GDTSGNPNRLKGTPREARALERAPMNGSWADGFNTARGKVITPSTKSSRSGPTMHRQRSTEPGGLWPPAQINTKGPAPGMKNQTQLATRVRGQETLRLCRRCA